MQKETEVASYRLQLGLRRNKGKQLLPKFLEDVSLCLDRPEYTILVVGLEQTDKLLQAFEASQSSGNKDRKFTLQLSWPESEIQEIKRVVNKWKEGVVCHRMFLFRSLSYYCGALETTSSEILDHAFQLVSLDQEELVAVSEDASSGLILGYNTQWVEIGTVKAYELLALGQEWLAVFGDTLAENSPPSEKLKGC